MERIIVRKKKSDEVSGTIVNKLAKFFLLSTKPFLNLGDTIKELLKEATMVLKRKRTDR